jgi:hypothetical protein
VNARLAEYQAQVEAQLKAHLASEAQRQAEMTAAVQRQLEELQTGREREREAAKNIQTHLANQLRELRTVTAQGTQPNSQGTQPNSKSDPATQDAGRATLRPGSEGVIKSEANMRREGPGVKNADELFAAQLHGTTHRTRTRVMTTMTTKVIVRTARTAVTSRMLVQAS